MLALHNEWTMCLFIFITFLHPVISATTGKPFAVSTIETYAAKVVTAMNVALGFPIMAQKTRFKKLLAAAAGATTVSAVRRKRQGIRRQHL